MSFPVVIVELHHSSYSDMATGGSKNCAEVMISFTVVCLRGMCTEVRNGHLADAPGEEVQQKARVSKRQR